MCMILNIMTITKGLSRCLFLSYWTPWPRHSEWAKVHLFTPSIPMQTTPHMCTCNPTSHRPLALRTLLKRKRCPVPRGCEDFSPAAPYRIPTIFALMSGAYTRLHIKILTRRKKCGRRRGRRRSKAPGLLRGSIPGLMSPAKEGSFLPPMCRDGKMQRRRRRDGRWGAAGVHVSWGEFLNEHI